MVSRNNLHYYNSSKFICDVSVQSGPSSGIYETQTSGAVIILTVYARRRSGLDRNVGSTPPRDIHN